MAITYVSRPWHRPTGVGALPLVLRNPRNDNTKKDYLKDGPFRIFRVAPGDYRGYFEGVTDQTGALDAYLFYATSPNGYSWTKANGGAPVLDPNTDWEQGELAINEWFWNPFRSEWFAYYHGGGNVGPRQIGLMTSPTGLPGTWTRYAGNPVLPNGGSGAWDELMVDDADVFILSANDARMIYQGVRASDSKIQLGYATSTDGGFTWTKYGSNPILPLGSGNDVNGVSSAWGYIDALGRIHLWHTGRDAGGEWRVLYAYSDDWTTWTRNQADIIAVESTDSTQPDYDSIGDVLGGMRDDGILWFTLSNRNVATYPDGLGVLDGRGTYWLPEKAAVPPARPARVFTKTTPFSRASVNAAGALMNSSIFTVWTDFRCPPGNTNRQFYTERNAFNKQIFVRLTTGGLPIAYLRTPTAEMFFTGAQRFDDNAWHRILFVRRANNDFEGYIDGVSFGSSTLNPGTIADAMFVNWGNWHSTVSDEPTMGLMRQSLTIQGRALTPAEELVLWNNGQDGGTLPAGVTATCWVKHGSGGEAGPDAAYGGATYGTTITGSDLVEAEFLAAIGAVAFLPLFGRYQRRQLASPLLRR